MLKDEPANKSFLLMANMLLKKFYSLKEITEILDIKPATFFKNLQMLKKAGFRIEKNKQKYKIEAYINVLNLASRNISILAYMMTLSNNMLPKNAAKAVFSFCKKIFYLSSKENYETFLERYNLFKRILSEDNQTDKIECFQKYIDKNENVQITLKDTREFILKPIKYCWGANNKTIFVFEDINSEERMEFGADEIVKMKVEKNAFKFDKSRETIFELSGRLADVYLLKEEEVLLESGKSRILIANYSSDKQKLFKRLLKYDVLCKVKFPAQDKNSFLKIIEKSLDNIDKFQDNNK